MVDYCFKLEHLSGLLPRACLLCGAVSNGANLCAPCIRLLPTPVVVCPRCAVALPVALTCGRCLYRPPAFDRCLAAFDYRYPVPQLIHLAKYRGRLDPLPVLVRGLADTLTAAAGELPEYLLPVPLHYRRQGRRGYNQAAIIAQQLGRRLGLPVLARALVRQRFTPAQTGLGYSGRRANVRGAFALGRLPPCTRVALVDDVMTTGATCDSLARLLKQAGVARVEVLVLARAGR